MDVQVVGRWGDCVVGCGRFDSRAGVRADAVVAGLDGWAVEPGETRGTRQVGSVVFGVEPVEPRRFRGDDRDDTFLGLVGGSGILHVALLVVLAFLLPGMGDVDEPIDHDRLVLMRSYLDARAEPEPERDVRVGAVGSATVRSDKSGIGVSDTVTTGPARGPCGIFGAGSSVSRSERLDEAGNFGIVGLLGSVDVGSGTSWGTGTIGSMWDGLDSTGVSGLDLGPGQGGGGPAGGIDLTGDPGGLGHCTVDCGVGGSHGTLPGPHVVRGPSVRPAPVVTTGGRLPPDTIRRVVQLGNGRVLACYETGLRRNPGLAGRVQVRFVIGRDGSVVVAQDSAGSDLPDPQVRACVVKTFLSLSFPEPQSGTVQVTYPYQFSPD